MPKIRLAAAMTLLMAFGIANTNVRADVLESVPADTLVALKVANLAKTSDKVAKLAKAFGIDAFVAPLQNPLGSLKQRAHIEKGLNESGELAVAYISPKSSGVPEDESIVLIVPVSSYADFLSNFGEAKTDGGVSEVTMPNESKPTYLADWNGYAALSPSKALVAKPAATLKIAGLSAKESAKQDFLVYTNFQKLSPELLPQLDKAMAKVTAELEKKSDADFDPKYKPLITVSIKQAFGIARTFLENSDSATLGLNISDAGLNGTLLADFKPDSYLGKFASSVKDTDAPLLTGLPTTKYFAFGGAAYDSTPVVKVFDDVTTPILDELKKIEDPATVDKLVTAFHAAATPTKGGVFGIPAPTKIGQEGLIQQVAVYRGGGNEWKAFFDQATDVAQTAVTGMKLPEGKPQPTFEKKPNAKSVEGVTFDSFKFEMKPPEGDPSAAQMQQMMTMMYGPDGPVTYYGVLGQDLVVANSVPDTALATFIKAAKANDDSLAKLDQVKVVTAELPKLRLAEYYVSIDEIVNTGVATAGQFGFPVQVQLPPELPPFGFTLGSDGTAIRVDAHIPSSTVQSLIAAGMQVFMQFNGGGGNL